jgi:hypothetical protein
MQDDRKTARQIIPDKLSSCRTNVEFPSVLGLFSDSQKSTGLSKENYFIAGAVSTS